MASQCNASLCAVAEKIVDDPEVLCYACVRVSQHCTASLPGDSLPCCLADSPLTLGDNNSRPDGEEDSRPRRASRSASGSSNCTAPARWSPRTIQANLWKGTARKARELVGPRTAVKRGCSGVSESPSPVTIVQRGAGSVERDGGVGRQQTRTGWQTIPKKSCVGKPVLFLASQQQRMASGGSSGATLDTDQQASANCSISCMTTHGKDGQRVCTFARHALCQSCPSPAVALTFNKPAAQVRPVKSGLVLCCCSKEFVKGLREREAGHVQRPLGSCANT
jgi:hypothetical protein